MRLVLLISLFVIACSHPAAPVAPVVHHNAAVDHARSLSKDAQCTLEVTGVGGAPDGAICHLSPQLVAYCWSGPGAGAECTAIADMRPRQPAQPGDIATTSATSDTPVAATTSSTAKTEPEKPKDAKAKPATPPKSDPKPPADKK